MELLLIIHHPFSNWCATENADSIFLFFSVSIWGIITLKYWVITNIRIWPPCLKWVQVLLFGLFFSKQDSLFTAWCISDRGCCYSTLVLMILQRFRVNMSLWVRCMIAPARLHDLHDQLIYLLPSLTKRAEHKALQQWILCFYYCKNGHFYIPSQCATHPINFSLFISINCLKSEVYLSKILEKISPKATPKPTFASLVPKISIDHLLRSACHSLKLIVFCYT